MIDYTLPLDQLPDPLPIEPLRKPFDVTITPPGSKSITCRAYVLAALAEGESKIIRPLRADDTDLLLRALTTLGVEVESDFNDLLIRGVQGRFPRGGLINLGEGGTPTRFMIACACLAAEPVVIDASARMRERPIAEGVDMLQRLGATIEYLDAEGRLPLKVSPSESFQGGELTIGRTASSQVISALLLIASFLDRGIAIRFEEPITSESYVDLTLGVLAEWGAKYETTRKPLRFSQVLSQMVYPSMISGREYSIPPDASSDVYWLVASSLIHGARMHLHDNMYADQPDSLCIDALCDAGVEHSDCYADFFCVGPATLKAFTFNATNSPDGALALAVLASRCQGRSRISGLRTLRVKETDRIAALANELRRVGCTVETGKDWIEIAPPASRAKSPDPPAEPGGKGLDPIIIETYNDHRMAMAFAVLGLARPNGKTLAIRNPKCVAKSYPTFWKDFAKLYQ